MSETQATHMAHRASDCISSLSVAERLTLARKAAEQLTHHSKDPEKYAAARRVAEALLLDLSLQVRETLAFELRKYRRLPKSIITKIACDVDEVAVPFLRVTPALSDSLMAELIPLLSDNAHLALAVRSDLGMKASRQLICHANDNAALKVIGNPSVDIDDTLADLALDHFAGNASVIDAIAKRPNLPMSVVSHILEQVSTHFRQQLVETYGVDAGTARTATLNSLHETIWRQIRHAAPGQIHAQAIDLRQAGKLTADLMLAMAQRGCPAFLESGLAVTAGHTLTEVREILHLANPKQFHGLMQACAMDYRHAEDIHKLARRLYGVRRGQREVGNPALWQKGLVAKRAPQSAA